MHLSSVLLPTAALLVHAASARDFWLTSDDNTVTGAKSVAGYSPNRTKIGFYIYSTGGYPRLSLRADGLLEFPSGFYEREDGLWRLESRNTDDLDGPVPINWPFAIEDGKFVYKPEQPKTPPDLGIPVNPLITLPSPTTDPFAPKVKGETEFVFYLCGEGNYMDILLGAPGYKGDEDEKCRETTFNVVYEHYVDEDFSSIVE